jgi:hypothetical protein
MAVMVVVDVIALVPVLARRMGVVLLMASASRTGTKAGSFSSCVFVLFHHCGLL